MRYIKEVNELRSQDIEDAFNYLNEILYPDSIDRREFDKAVSKSTVQDIPMSLISHGFQGDNKRRPKAASRLNNPIIVVHRHKGYIIIDGNHRFLQHKNMGKETIKGIILEFPQIWKRSKGKSGYFIMD